LRAGRPVGQGGPGRRYYKALTNLLFMDSLTESSFDRFVHPMEEVSGGGLSRLHHRVFGVDLCGALSPKR